MQCERRELVKIWVLCSSPVTSPGCCAASSSPRLTAEPCLYLIPSHRVPFLASSSLSTDSVSCISLVKSLICLPPWFSHKHNPWPCPNFKVGHCTSHPKWLLTMLSVSVISMQTCDPCSPLKKKSTVHHCPILFFPIVFLPSANSVLFCSLRIPWIFPSVSSFMTSALCEQTTPSSLLSSSMTFPLVNKPFPLPSGFLPISQ